MKHKIKLIPDVFRRIGKHHHKEEVETLDYHVHLNEIVTLSLSNVLGHMVPLTAKERALNEEYWKELCEAFDVDTSLLDE